MRFHEEMIDPPSSPLNGHESRTMAVEFPEVQLKCPTVDDYFTSEFVSIDNEKAENYGSYPTIFFKCIVSK